MRARQVHWLVRRQASSSRREYLDQGPDNLDKTVTGRVQSERESDACRSENCEEQSPDANPVSDVLKQPGSSGGIGFGQQPINGRRKPHQQYEYPKELAPSSGKPAKPSMPEGLVPVVASFLAKSRDGVGDGDFPAATQGLDIDTWSGASGASAEDGCGRSLAMSAVSGQVVSSE